jgi:hypothetical protein
MNIRQEEQAVGHLKQYSSIGKILLLTGPYSSGKTTLACKILQLYRVKEFSGFDTDIHKELHFIHKCHGLKTVADYAGLSHGDTKPNAVLIEDIEFCDIATIKSIIQFARLKIMPVVAVAATPSSLEHILLDNSVTIRCSRPTPRQIQDILVSQDGIDVKTASVIANHCGSDIRQARIAKTTCSVDKPRVNNIYDAASLVFTSSSLQSVVDLFDFDTNLLPMMMAENYVKCKSTDTCMAAHDISTADTLYKCDDKDVPQVFSLASSHIRGHRLSSRPIYPSWISQKTVMDANVKRMPKGISYDTINTVERRIVHTLNRGVPVALVAKEMRSMNLFSLSQWESIRDLAPVGREPLKIPLAIKNQLKSFMNQK